MWGQKHQSTEEEFEASTKCSDNSGGKEKELADGVVSPSGRVMTVDRQLLYKAVGHVYSKLVMPGEEGGLKDWIQGKMCTLFNAIQRRTLHNGYRNL